MSTLNVANITDGTDTVGTSYVLNGSAKVWCALNDNNVLAQSFNISSITDVSAGIVQYAYSSSMAGAINAITVGGNDNNYGNRSCFVKGNTTASGTRTVFIEGNATTVEDDWVNITVHGDLA